MTDQPLPLKPCPFCGKRGLSPDGIFVKHSCYTVEALAPTVDIWNDAYCWKLLAEKEVETKAPNELLHQTHKDLNEARAKIQEQASHVRVLTDALEIIIKEVEEDNLKISTFCRLNAKSALDRVKGK